MSSADHTGRSSIDAATYLVVRRLRAAERDGASLAGGTDHTAIRRDPSLPWCAHRRPISLARESRLPGNASVGAGARFGDALLARQPGPDGAPCTGGRARPCTVGHATGTPRRVLLLDAAHRQRWQSDCRAARATGTPWDAARDYADQRRILARGATPAAGAPE